MPAKSDVPGAMSLPRQPEVAISAAGQAGLLGMAFARIAYGFGAMVIVGVPFIAWCIHLGHDATGLMFWTAWYAVGTPVVRRLSRQYQRELAVTDPQETMRKWSPVIHAIALVYGLSMAVPAFLTAHHATFEFHLLYMVTVAAIVAGNSVHSSTAPSVFRCFFVTGWGGVTLLVPYTFPQHWHYVLPLTLIHSITMLRHSAISYRFYVQHIVLQEEGERLAEDFRRAKDEAEKALYDKNLFLTTASHDLRQPVHAMGFLVESIKQRNQDPALNLALSDLRQSVHSATQMFNALLDLSKIESGRVQIKSEAVDLAEVVNNVATTFREEARNRALSLRVHLPTEAAFALADATLLRQSLCNLVHNALRYTGKGGILLAVRRRGATWQCEVWDTGIGVAASDDADLFSPFFRNEHAKGIDSAGHGLGLAVVARCCSLMRAEYGFRSRERRGSCFWIALAATTPAPAALTAHPQEPAHALLPPRWAGCCLVVDDDPLVRSAWETLLASWGLQVACVESGGQAIRMLDEGFSPQAIFCDQRLRSGESGFKLLRTLLERLPEASGAMISGELDSTELAVAEEQGYLVLRKPVDPLALQAVLGHWLNGASK